MKRMRIVSAYVMITAILISAVCPVNAYADETFPDLVEEYTEEEEPAVVSEEEQQEGFVDDNEEEQADKTVESSVQEVPETAEAETERELEPTTEPEPVLSSDSEPALSPKSRTASLPELEPSPAPALRLAPESALDNASNDEGLEYVENDDGTITVTGPGSNTTGNLVIPEKINGKTVTGIANMAFCGYEELTGDLYIPDTVTSIGRGAFWGCTGLDGKLHISTSVTRIEPYTFCNCYSLTGDITIPYGVTYIGSSAFAGCSGFEGNISIPATVKTIEENAFYECYDLSGPLVLPDELEQIGLGAFYMCSNLSGDLVIPGEVESVETLAFSSCYGFEGKLVLSNGIKKIEEAAFQGCAGFTGDLVIPDSMEEIDKMAFYNSYSAREGKGGNLVLPSKLKKLGEGAFAKCSNLTGSLTVSEGLEAIEDETFSACGFTGTLTLPSTLRSIGKDAFWGCEFTGNLTIPDKVTSIGDTAFIRGNTSNVMKGTLTIPASVTGIGYRAFYGYDSLSVIQNRSACDLPAEWFFSGNSEYYYNDAGEKVTADGVFPTGTWRRYVEPSEVIYTITYELNGGTNHASNPDTYKITTDTITLMDPVRKGYTFGGWFSDSGLAKQVTQIKKGSQGDRTLYSKWTVNRYTIRYDGNGSTGGTMSDQTCKYGSTYKLFANAFKKKGYKFAGWNTKADGSGTAYSDATEVGNLSSKNKAVVTMYSQWKKLKYSITYDVKGGTNNEGNPAAYTVTSSDITLKDPVRKGYTFAGWFSDSSYKTKVSQIKKGSTGNRTLYAKWTANRYTIRFNGNDSTDGTMGDMKSCKYSVQYTLTPNAFKRRGFRFTGWNTRADGTGKTYTDRTLVSNLSAKNNAVVNLYAQWSKVKYTLSYEVRGGNDNSANPTSYTVTSSFTLKEPTRKCYTFSGWFSDNEYKKPINQIKKGTVGNRTLYGKWLINKYKVRFNGNGSTSGSMSDMTCKCNQSYELTVNSYKRTGYIFNGWNTKADGSGTSYKNRASILNLAVKSGKTITLYARWRAINYTVRFSGNGSKAGKMSDVSCRFSKSYKLPVNAYSRPNYRFIGWNTKADGSGKTYADLATVKNLSAKDGAVVTLYAMWKKKQTIVWLGDSLTQGSLGDKGDNLDNAPYVRLAGKVDVPVEGYGFYGYKTREIFDAYQYDCGQSIDPGKIYIFWVGSCDWVDDGRANSETGPVIAQIDDFLCKKGRIKNYIVLGTTSRHRLGNKYIPINRDLSEHYGSHYMDVIDIINRYGYSSDRTHLSQASYDAIADAVYDKMKRLGYL
ncbi:MAG: InlB B-repeat-containing protein [Lachnospiraceae bacterium]|nr:InlB B-repeat-containing protein [Lachnospiraceae bacterium]